MENQPEYEEIDLVDYLKVLYKHWKMIIVIVFIGMVSAGLSSLNQPKLYEAKATFFPLEYEYPESFEVTKPSINMSNLIISILESREMADKVINQLKLKEKWDTEGIVGTRKNLRGAISVNLEKNGLIALSVKAKASDLPAKIANAYVDNLDFFSKEIDIGPQKKLVQVIDKAVVPEEGLGRQTKKKVAIAGFVVFMLAVFLAFFVEFVKKSNVIERLRQE